MHTLSSVWKVAHKEFNCGKYTMLEPTSVIRGVVCEFVLLYEPKEENWLSNQILRQNLQKC